METNDLLKPKSWWRDTEYFIEYVDCEGKTHTIQRENYNSLSKVYREINFKVAKRKRIFSVCKKSGDVSMIEDWVELKEF
jgi:hypothetical protein